MVSCNGSFAEYDSDGDTYFKQLSLGQNFEKMRKIFVNVIKKLKNINYQYYILYTTEAIKKMKKECLCIAFMKQLS